LVLGEITTIAVAWGCANIDNNDPPIINLVSNMFSATGFGNVRAQLLANEIDKNYYLSVILEENGKRLLVTEIKSQLYTSGEAWVKKWEEVPDFQLVAAKIKGTGIEHRILYKCKIDSRRRYNQSLGGGIRVEQRVLGWPLKSLYYNPSNASRNSTTYRGREKNAWRLPNIFSKFINEADELILPHGVLWQNIAVNTIFYATILWLLALSPFAIRRYFRNKRGLCNKCGYDLRGMEHELCPECGGELICDG